MLTLAHISVKHLVHVFDMTSTVISLHFVDDFSSFAVTYCQFNHEMLSSLQLLAGDAFSSVLILLVP